MSVYTVSHLTHDAGVGVHVVRDTEIMIANDPTIINRGVCRR